MKKGKIFIIPAVIIIVILFVLMLVPQVLKRYTGPVPDFKKFYKSDLDTICGVELRQDERTFANVACTKYWNNRNVETEYDRLTFYVFDSSSKAKKAYKKVARNFKGYIEESESDYFIAEEPDTIDANVTKLYYIHNNLIIETDVNVTSEWAVSPDGIIPGSDNDPYTYIADREELINTLRSTF